jgi:hypothetical protein
MIGVMIKIISITQIRINVTWYYIVLEIAIWVLICVRKVTLGEQTGFNNEKSI